MQKPIIAIDFDGVIYHRPKSETGYMTFDAEPVPGAMNFLRHLVKPFQVVIFSSRLNCGADEYKCRLEMREWLRKQMHIDNDNGVRRGKPPYDPLSIVDQLDFTATKPVARVYLDDRAINFNGIFPTIPSLLAFKTWDNR